MYDLLIKNGQVVTPDLSSGCNIAVKDGKIATIPNRKVMNLSGG